MDKNDKYFGWVYDINTDQFYFPTKEDIEKLKNVQDAYRKQFHLIRNNKTNCSAELYAEVQKIHADMVEKNRALNAQA